jgi:hypothetical protein
VYPVVGWKEAGELSGRAICQASEPTSQNRDVGYPASQSGRKVAAEEAAVEGELLVAEGVGVGGQGFTGEGASMHGVNPVERERGDAVDDAADATIRGIATRWAK